MMQETYADPMDRATLEEERHLEENIRKAREAKEPQLPDKGFCYNCDEPLATGRFCDGDCRDDHELRMSRRRVNGIKG